MSSFDLKKEDRQQCTYGILRTRLRALRSRPSTNPHVTVSWQLWFLCVRMPLRFYVRMCMLRVCAC